MLQVILNDFWELEEVQKPIPGSMIHVLKLTHTQTGECFERTRFDIGKQIFIDPAPEVRPKERKLLAQWLAKGAPR